MRDEALRAALTERGIEIPRCACEVCMRAGSMCPADMTAAIEAIAAHDGVSMDRAFAGIATAPCTMARSHRCPHCHGRTYIEVNELPAKCRAHESSPDVARPSAPRDGVEAPDRAVSDLRTWRLRRRAVASATRTPGRPPEGTDGQRRTARIEVHVSEGEREAMVLAALAQEPPMSVAQWLREVGLRAARVRTAPRGA